MQDYFIGIDAGTESCGIAATDEQYDLLRCKGNDMWAVNLFDKANDATKRRQQRAVRRRLFRRKQRIDLLQDVFYDEIAKKDEKFFIKLNNSAFVLEDKDESVRTECTLFADPDYTDREYYKKYPTIFHLRKALVDGSETEIRHFYLAFHHIIKYRGHFIFEGQKIDSIKDVAPVLKEINDFIAENFEDSAVYFDVSKANELQDALNDRTWNRTNGAKAIERIFNLNTKQGKEFCKALAGGKFDLSVLFDNELYKDNETSKYSFKESTEENFAKLLEECGDDATLIELLKKVYDWEVFIKMLKGKNYISDAMVAIYEKHKSDLRKLKNLVRKYMSDADYKEIFRQYGEKLNNYSAYAGIAKTNGVKHYVERCKDKKDFYAFLKKKFDKHKTALQNDEDYQSIISDMENETFMPRIIDADSGVFPYQINEIELKEICDKLADNYPSFNEKDESGYTKIEKIKKIFRFRIPYYVGPLTVNPDVKSNAWIVKKKDEKVLPWNFEEVVDTEACAERFIRRMTNKCSYLKGADVIPKCSILYSKFMTLNQLNKLTINELPITVWQKQMIFEKLFLTDKKPTKKKLTRLLINEGLINKNEQPVYGGIDTDFTVNMASYVAFRSIFGDKTEENIGVIEEIILIMSLFTDKNDVERLVLKKFGHIPEVQEKIKVIKGFNFKDFGKLSKEFLTELSAEDEVGDGELPVTIMDLLWDTNMNLMEIINDDKYGFAEKIKEYNGEEDSDVKFEDLDDYYLSPMVKRGVWRALVMVDEYVKALKNPPKKIFIEVTRGDGEKGKRTKSRLTELQEFYKANRQFIKDYDDLIQELNRKNEQDLRQERLYLYFKQLGRCMYSGEKIVLEYLSTNTYDIDHIIPQSLKKDDSIHNNKVLVLRERNKTKSDDYPINPDWQRKNIAFWKLLRDKGCITAEKYARLTRKDEITESEMHDFINRQIVVTGQSATALARILQRKYPSSKIVYSKAGNVSDFRQKYNLLKNRNVNDLHHARDAYLNIVVGNVFDTRFGIKGTGYCYYDENGNPHRYNLTKIYNHNVGNAWDTEVTIDTVKRNYNKNSMIVVRRPSIGRGEFYNQTVYRKGKGIIPIKSEGPMSNLDKYGGYQKSETKYFMTVDSLDKKGKHMRTIEAMSIYYDKMISIGKMTMEQYLTEIRGLNQPEVVFSPINVRSLIRYNGSLATINGVTGDRLVLNNANQWHVDSRTSDYLRIVDKFLEMKNLFEKEKDGEEILVSSSRDGARKDTVSRKDNLLLYELIKRQLSKEIYKGLSAFETIKKYVETGKDKFSSTDLIKQCETITELVKFLQCKGLLVNLSEIGGSVKSGIMLASKKITDCEVVLYNISLTGLYKNSVVLNKPQK